MSYRPINSRVFITGGAGYLGKNLIKDLYQNNEITVFSRDEAKHYFLKKEFPKVKFIVGDIRNFDHLNRSMRGMDIGIFAASMKQIEACETNYEEANQIIVQGAFNSKKAAIDNKLKAACFISSDKSRAASTIYGSMKFTASESFISNNEDVSTRLVSVVYGNVVNSTGSIIPLIWKYIKNDKTLSLFGEDMTRFLLTIEEAMDLIYKSLQFNNVNVVPAAMSFKVKDLFNIYHDIFKLKYDITVPRPNEKIHELMIAPEEMPRTTWNDQYDVFNIHKNIQNNAFSFTDNEYSSRNCLIDEKELYEFLEEHNFYKP